jgi:hypothetical protein
VARPEPVLCSELPDVGQLSFTELRAAGDRVLLAGIDRMACRSRQSDTWLAAASRRFD